MNKLFSFTKKQETFDISGIKTIIYYLNYYIDSKLLIKEFITYRNRIKSYFENDTNKIQIKQNNRFLTRSLVKAHEPFTRALFLFSVCEYLRA